MKYEFLVHASPIKGDRFFSAFSLQPSDNSASLGRKALLVPSGAICEAQQRFAIAPENYRDDACISSLQNRTIQDWSVFEQLLKLKTCIVTGD